MDAERVSLNREEMRALGYAAVDALIEHFESLDATGAGVRGERPALERALREPPPEQPSDPVKLIALLRERVFNTMLHVDHPRFFAFVPSPGNFVGAVADALASGFNAFVGTWFSGSGPAEIELITIDWLRQLCGLPETAGGLFVSGGSIANLTALAVARHQRLGYTFDDAVAYYSDQTHSAVERAFRILGFAPAQMRRLACDGAYRLPSEALAREVAADGALGRRPNTESTSTRSRSSIASSAPWLPAL